MPSPASVRACRQAGATAGTRGRRGQAKQACLWQAECQVPKPGGCAGWWAHRAKSHLAVQRAQAGMHSRQSLDRAKAGVCGEVAVTSRDTSY